MGLLSLYTSQEDGNDMPKEYRTLCSRCMSDYKQAGYVVQIISCVHESCDKCARPGVVCEVKEWQKSLRKPSTKARHGKIVEMLI